MGLFGKIMSFLTGPRGGEYHINSRGNKDYGDPAGPRAEKPKAPKAPEKPKAPKAAEKPKAKPVPPKRRMPSTPATKPAVSRPVPESKTTPPVVNVKPAPATPGSSSGHGLPIVKSPKPLGTTPAVSPPAHVKKPRKGSNDDRVPFDRPEPLSAQIGRLHPDYQNAIKQAGFDRLLAKYPANFRFNANGIGRGLYSGYADSKPRVSFSPSLTDAKNPYRVPPKGSTGAASVAADKHSTLIHELSHHLHFTIARKTLKDFHASTGKPYQRELSVIRPLEALTKGHYDATPHAIEATPGGKLLQRVRDAHAAKARNGAVSKYARGNAAEWFAETHTAYVQRKDDLRKQRPEEYALVRDVRAYMGLPE